MGTISAFIQRVLSSGREKAAPTKSAFGTGVGKQAQDKQRLKDNEMDVAVAKEQSRKSGM